jgi:2-succinyl-5-enolpyruvyl-6-hydroxy-3-cyclohexene-1-carboxylate synthase
MNPAVAFAGVVVDELVRCGVREAVLAPGSRSAPLALALAEADRAGRLRLHVRIDERTAGFLAIGLIRGSGLPVPVVTTSGTAVANLHPAVLEASYAGLPLVVLTADRPPELRGVGANQAPDQIKIFGSDVRFFHEVGTPVARRGQVAYWRSLVARALARAQGNDPGPVHLNCPLAEPLVSADESWVEPLDGGRSGPWTTVTAAAPSPYAVSPGKRTVVVAGDGASQSARIAAEAGNWPLFAEPSSRARIGPNVIPSYRLLLGSLGDRIERVLLFGHPTLSRPITRLLSREDIELIVVAPHGRWPDAGHRAATVVPGLEVPGPDVAGSDVAGSDVAGSDVAGSDVAGSDVTGEGDGAWLALWQEAEARVRPAIEKVLGDGLNGPVVAATVAEAVGADGMLVVASSNPVRDLDLAPVVPIRTIANRGLSGIDGTVSTAVGAALVNGGPAYALIGDLAFLHDQNGLVIGPDEPRPDLRIVVVNDDGGGIFGLLEQGAPEHAKHFERVFGTPHGTDLAAVCASTGTPHTVAASIDELRAVVERTVAGIDVVEVRLDRSAHRDHHARLAAAVSEALGSG